MSEPAKTTDRKQRRRVSHRLSEGDKGQLTITLKEDGALQDLLGMATHAAAAGVLTTGLISLGTRGKNDRDMLSAMAIEMEPKDAVEAMLVNQMTATNAALSWSMQQMVDAKTLDVAEAFDRITNRLARTFTTQVDALKRYRAKAQQVVRVERVTVNDGGQAIVGDVTHQGGNHENRR